MLTKKLSIFSNSRKIRDYIKNADDDFLPKLLPIHEFENIVIYKDGFSKASQIERILLMQEAIKKTKDCQNLLHIKSELLAFLKNSEYIFSFFTELAKEKKTIDDLKNSDIYANYDEHLDILQTLLQNYENALEEKKLYDEITIVQNYNINDIYLTQFDEIEIYIDGIFSNFEWDLILQVSQFSNINLNFQTSNLNAKLVDKISQIFSLEFKNYHRYRVNINRLEILQDEPIEVKGKILLKEFKQKSLQALYIFEKISTFIRAGISAKDIVVILPDESFAKILRVFDRTNMLNFAMGQSFKQTSFFVVFENLLTCIKEKNFPDFELYSYDEISLILSFYEINEEFYQKFKELYFAKTLVYEEIVSLILELYEILKLSKDLKDKILLKLFEIESLIVNQSISNRDIFEILLMNLGDIKIDDVTGGEVSVIGVLESRSLEVQAAIIVDFNDDLVPKRSVNEMFLNSSVRSHAGLISYLDRENLQRFYYESIVLKARVVAISYLKNEEKIPSRFLEYFKNSASLSFGVKIIEDSEFSDSDYLSILKTYLPAKQNLDFINDIKQRFNIFYKPISYTKLQTFLTCKRRFFYRYIKNLQEPKQFVNDKNRKEIGDMIHKALESYFRQNIDERVFDYEKFALIFKNFAKAYKINRITQEIWLERFKKFKVWQDARFNNGFIVDCVEARFEREFNGIKIEGKIDRIDQSEDGFEIIDYKSSSSINDKSFQLEFYKALVDKENIDAKFLELKGLKLIAQNEKVNELSFIECLDELKSQTLQEIVFEKIEKKEVCKNCTYRVICRRDFRE